ncbi:Hypothetical protein D9617_24g016940 [Elsinoe fawcettii]|nr:Hypothetical protein D9617_24g016940 [Elsinoe fawcettii]
MALHWFTQKIDTTPDPEDLPLACEAIFTGTSKSPLCENAFKFQLSNSPTKSDFTHTHHKSLLIKSTNNFTVEQVAIEFGSYKGRTALILDPKPAGGVVLPFMKLPTEVRYMIYHELLVVEGSLTFIGSRYRDNGVRRYSRNGDDIYTGILEASKDIRKEALEVALGENKFHFSSSTHSARFLKSIGSGTMHLKHITVDYSISANFGATTFRLLAAASEHLRIHLPQNVLLGNLMVPLCKSFLRVRVPNLKTTRALARKEVARLVAMFDTIHVDRVCKKWRAPACGMDPTARCECLAEFTQRMQGLEKDLLREMGVFF